MIGQQARFKKIHSFLSSTNKIRNVSIVAHVDHGKTTLADCLIASNGIIHKKQAGQLKLLDDRLDQQNRGITMKSSSICLLSNDHLVNLIDSPGHLEFYCEVSAALRLTDSALLVVDVVEGVSSQTYRVLNQLYHQKLPSILVLNKIDKLITQCKMDPLEAYNHLNQIIQQVNAILGSFIMKQIGMKIRKKSTSEGQQQQRIQKLQDKFYFAPEKRNIIFGSALDNWGFAVQNFAPLLAKKIGLEPQKIIKYLWGDYYYSPKRKQFSEKPKNQNDRPLCVDFILKPIWDIFEAVESRDNETIQKIITKLKLKVSENSKKKYGFNLTKQILNGWHPLDKIVLSRIIQVLPNPKDAQNFRLPYLLQLNTRQSIISPKISKALALCSHHEEEPLIIFISKMVSIPKANFNERGLNEIQGKNNNNVSLAFGRIFSGKCKRGSQATIIGAKNKKIEDEKGNLVEVPDLTKIKIERLYVFNAQYPQGIEEAYAGNIVGIGGLEDYIFKSGTVSTEDNCISFMPVASQTKSILKVSVTTPNIEDNQKMIDGLKKINRTDPSVDVYAEPTGDIILNTCGEVHLQKCLVDLQQIYCKVPVKASDPIINFRETIVWSNPVQNKNSKYIEEKKKKKEEEMKKLMKQKYKEALMIDAEIDDLEKEKLKAIEQWDSHVEKYDSEDLTAQDTRFFFKNREDEEEEKYNYKQEKQMKKADHKNRGKLHSKKQFLNLNMKTNINSQLTPNQIIQITVKAISFDFQLAEYLEKNSDRMKKLFSNQNSQTKENQSQNFQADIEQFIGDLKQKMNDLGIEENVKDIILKDIVCFGSNGYGPNILAIKKLNPKLNLFSKILNKYKIDDNEQYFEVSEKMQKLLGDYKTSSHELFNSILTGFSLACSAGPLCHQPLIGVIFILQNVERVEKKEEETMKEEKGEQMENQKNKQAQKKEQKEEDNSSSENEKIFADSFGPIAGQVMSTMKDACLESFLGASPRLVQPMYLCELQTDQQYYGSIYNELSKRRAKIIEQDLHEISNVFIIKAHLPITQSFKLCSQILDRTQGTVNAQLHFDTWKIYNEDPFYIPLTQQEIQEDGLEILAYNSARNLLEKIRQKKGLKTTQKIVAAAEKQRTLKKK